MLAHYKETVFKTKSMTHRRKYAKKTKKKTKSAILFLPIKKYLFLEYDMVKMIEYKTFLKIFFKFSNVKIKKVNSHRCRKRSI